MLKIRRMDAFHAFLINISNCILLTEIASRAQKRISAHLRFYISRATSSLFKPQLEIIKRLAA